MELEEMKKAWERLDQRMDQQLSLGRKLLLNAELTRARKGLRPLFWGQIIQMVFGILIILTGVVSWTINRGILQQMVPGLIIHFYGILTVILSGITLGKIQGINYSAPVAAIQKQLARLRYLYLMSGIFLGLSWWLIWIPFMAALFNMVGVDFIAKAPSVIYIGTGIGALGLAGTWLFHQWAHHPSRPGIAKMFDDAAAGGSLNRASRILEEIREFEKE